MKMTIEGVDLPQRQTEDSCGYDIYAPCDMVITRDATKYDLGILMEPGDIPKGYFALILPRSSTGNKGLCIRNTAGVIDSDYTMDTIKATLYIDDHGGDRMIDVAHAQKLEFPKNSRILQMILVPHGIIPTEIPPTQKREGGIGSTGQ